MDTSIPSIHIFVEIDDVYCNIQIYWQRTLKPQTACLIVILRKHEVQLHEVYQMC